MTIYKGDNTGAFGNTFITINLVNPYEETVKKCEFRCGDILKTFSNPTFPLTINFDEKETKCLQSTNVCYLAAWDSQNRKKTCKGELKFNTKNEVV